MEPPRIEPVPEGIHRPLWSVMIPTFNCAAYLRQTLESVLVQDPGAQEMQIEVIDDCSTKDDPETVVRELGKGRVAFYRKPKNEGVVANFNTCIQRSRGRLVHILHGDDYVLPKFYERIGTAVKNHPSLALFASRSFFVDEENIIFSVTQRLRNLESGSKITEDFFYTTPIQTPGVVVKRSFYESHGGFSSQLVHTADCEMWSRAVGFEGGLVTQEVLACYRKFASNDSGRLARTGENLRDYDRLNELFAERYPDFNPQRAKKNICFMAIRQMQHFSKEGNLEAVKANIDYWKRNAPTSLRIKQLVKKMIGIALGKGA